MLHVQLAANDGSGLRDHRHERNSSAPSRPTTLGLRIPLWLGSGWEYRGRVFPEGEEILIGGTGFGGVTGHGISSAELKMGKSTDE
jgi:hypothetical protein